MKLDALLPIAAPAPAGLIIGVQLYKATIDTVGLVSPDWALFVHGAAGLFAAVGCAGMIGAEIVAYKQAGVAFAEKQTGAAIISLVAGVVCSALVIWAVSTGNKPQAVIASVVVSIAGYVALAARDFLARRRGVIASGAANIESANNFALSMAKEQTKQAAAAARLAKASVAPVRVVREQDERPERPANSRSLGADKIAEIRAYQIANPEATVRDVAAACKVSNASVQKYGIM